MSHTNSTPNYNLPQFIGTDKPTWLTDVNGALNTIDTQMKANADSATSASTSAITANNAIGTLADLNTKEKTNLVGAINEANTNAGTAQNTANNASSTATSASTTANGLATYFNINTFNTATVSTSDASVVSGTVRTATNEEGSLGKVYGSMLLTPNNSPTITITSPFRPTSVITINELAIIQDMQSKEIYGKDVSIATNGNITINIQAYFNARQIKVWLPACVIFAKDFGDTSNA